MGLFFTLNQYILTPNKWKDTLQEIIETIEAGHCQPQVEGLFNKLDLKTHPNMSPSVKQSKLRLSSDKITKENLTDGLKEMRKQRTKQRTPLQEVQFGSNIASTLFKQFIE
ncbi:453_t:CDS:2 [Rhizophagus irregularis]|nr:453_t:CDS:2 [Rhizophagus irregularis]